MTIVFRPDRTSVTRPQRHRWRNQVLTTKHWKEFYPSLKKTSPPVPDRRQDRAIWCCATLFALFSLIGERPRVLIHSWSKMEQKNSAVGAPYAFKRKKIWDYATGKARTSSGRTMA
jgi:hypothetical protein